MKVFITYVDLLNTARERQEDLQATYYFLCQCTRCLDRSELELQRSMLCPNIKCGEPVPIFQMVCLHFCERKEKFFFYKNSVREFLSYPLLFKNRKHMGNCVASAMNI